MEEYARPSMELKELFMKYRESYEGKVIRSLIKKLDPIAKILLKRHDINCCSRMDNEHLKFQCCFSKEVLIANYHWNNYIHLGFKEVEQFVLFMGASEIESFMSENYETCVACHDLKYYVASILDHCIENCSNNFYIIDYKERLNCAQECILHLQEPVEEEVAEPEISLNEKEEESEDSNSLTRTLYDYPQCLPEKEESYIVEFVHDATERYYERGKHGYMHLNNI